MDLRRKGRGGEREEKLVVVMGDREEGREQGLLIKGMEWLRLNLRKWYIFSKDIGFGKEGYSWWRK